MIVKLGLPSKLVHLETKEVVKNYPPYTVFEMAKYNPKTGRGFTTFSYDTENSNLRYPRGIVYGKLGAKFAGYIT